LDIGSGYGFFSRAAMREGFKVTAINPGEWENDIFEKLNGFRPIPKLFEDINFGDEKFSLVIMSHVLEHLRDPLAILARIKNLLDPQGVVAIAVPNFNSLLVKILGTKDNSCLLVPDHLTYFSKKGLLTLLERAGFKVYYHEYKPNSIFTFK
jgi:2-polyprenyl-3-methyl-5-hydroxy-6-metoxy-1,4-benzoquinol methylase